MRINLIELFEESVKKYPQKVAVIEKEREITFSDLREQAIMLAQRIIYGGTCQNRPVAVFLDKSIESVYSDLGIIYSGNFYMNLDIKTPAERIRNILKLVEPRFIISTSKQIKCIEAIIPETIDVILLDVNDRKLFLRGVTLMFTSWSLQILPKPPETFPVVLSMATLSSNTQKRRVRMVLSGLSAG